MFKVKGEDAGNQHFSRLLMVFFTLLKEISNVSVTFILLYEHTLSLGKYEVLSFSPRSVNLNVAQLLIGKSVTV